ncbi:MAG: aldehyde ferredoxin oxidoreductase family protein [Coriobacteriia bacterium]|nr:aldehyde ferredoxin oxidoreductase family protein [Coriobacteriia bacterium]MCL2750048.1 aldehyde ferredoxin oxidoreductase family protein [Coriobacteriia bacterium]
MKGIHQKILRINLSNGESRIEKRDEAFYRAWLGGRGMGAKILYDEVPTTANPLGPENILFFGGGPLSGVFAPAAGKASFVTKSPLTGGYADSNIGGHIGPELKYAGYDALILEGIAPGPSLLIIDDDKVIIKPADYLWGKGTFETEKALKDELGEDFQIAAIGPAGENLVKIACIQHDYGRQAGRLGVGAVMGSKKLKAFAIRGTQDIPVADPAQLLELGKKAFLSCYSKPGFEEWTPMGTAGVTNWVNENGAFPTRNFSTTYYPGYLNMNGESLLERILKTDKGCFSCPTPCGKYSSAAGTFKGADKEEKFEVMVEGPEYETIALVGGNCELASIEEVAYANYVMDDLGIDTMSAGGIVAFTLECIEKGVLGKERFDGRELKFGSLDSVLYLSELIARREGIGDLLAEGVKVAAAEIGGNSEHYAIQIKGLEQSGYDSRNAPAMMLAYMTADVGAHHNRAWAIWFDVEVGVDILESKAERVIQLQHIRPFFDLMGCCRLQWVELGLELEYYTYILNAVTGCGYTWNEMMQISEKVYNLTRMFWVKHVPGIGRSWDWPPPRMVEEEVPSGPSEGKKISIENLNWLLDRYYHLRGWDSNGIPTAEQLQKIGLPECVKDLN